MSFCCGFCIIHINLRLPEEGSNESHLATKMSSSEYLYPNIMHVSGSMNKSMKYLFSTSSTSAMESKFCNIWVLQPRVCCSVRTWRKKTFSTRCSRSKNSRHCSTLLPGTLQAMLDCACMICLSIFKA